MEVVFNDGYLRGLHYIFLGFYARAIGLLLKEQRMGYFFTYVLSSVVLD